MVNLRLGASGRCRACVLVAMGDSGRRPSLPAQRHQREGTDPTMSQAQRLLASAAALGLLAGTAQAASHREAPLTSIDRTADIPDWYAFVSPDAPHTVTMILTVDPLLEPSNGPNYFPFDDNLLYEFNIDNDQDARGRQLRGAVHDGAAPAARAGGAGRRRQRRARAQELAGAHRGGLAADPAGDHRAGRARRRRDRPAPDLRGRDGQERPAHRRWRRLRPEADRAAEQCRAADHAQVQELFEQASFSWTGASRCSPAPPTTSSTSISAPPSTR